MSYWTDNYHKLKEQGICVRCRTEKAVEGKTYCEWCRKKMKISRTEEYKIKNRINSKNKYHYNKEHGLCVNCGTPISQELRCETCSKKHKEYVKKSLKKKANKNI